jgi:hypothetical protein
MNIKSRKIIIKNILLFALLFGLVFLNKKVFRPNFMSIPLVNILTGSFPNFIAAYLISLAFINPVLMKNPNYGRVIAYVSSALVFIILTIEEIKPVWGASEHYDLYDIVASGLGSLLAIFTYEIIIFFRKHELK